MEENVSISPWKLLSSVLVSDEEMRQENLLAFREKIDTFFANTLSADTLFQRFYRDRLLVVAHECVFPDVRQVCGEVLRSRGLDLELYKQPVTMYWDL